jgi:hypothetical protein
MRRGREASARHFQPLFLSHVQFAGEHIALVGHPDEL